MEAAIEIIGHELSLICTKINILHACKNGCKPDPSNFIYPTNVPNPFINQASSKSFPGLTKQNMKGINAFSLSLFSEFDPNNKQDVENQIIKPLGLLLEKINETLQLAQTSIDVCLTQTKSELDSAESCLLQTISSKPSIQIPTSNKISSTTNSKSTNSVLARAAKINATIKEQQQSTTFKKPVPVEPVPSRPKKMPQRPIRFTNPINSPFVNARFNCVQLPMLFEYLNYVHSFALAAYNLSD